MAILLEAALALGAGTGCDHLEPLRAGGTPDLGGPDLASTCPASPEGDPMNCGACGRVCGATCTRGACDVYSFFVAADATHVYWTNYGDGTVRRMPLGGGASTLVATGQLRPAGIAVDRDFVYWANG